MSSNKPVVMMVDPFLERFSPLFNDSYELVKLWEAPSEDAFFATEGQRVGAVVTIGHFPARAPVLSRLPNLGLVACFSTGFEGVDVDWCRENGVAVTNGAAANGGDVADQAAMLLLNCYRRATQGGRVVRDGSWQAVPGLAGRSLRGKKVGIVGMGRIGRMTAQRIAAFETEIHWYGPNPKPDIAYPRAESVVELARICDALVVVAPATPETEKMINREVLDALGPQGVVVNISRGSLVDEDALIAALKEGRLWGAGLDVFEVEPTDPARWADVPNAELMPHSAGSTPEGGKLMSDRFLENLRCFFAGEPLVSPLF
ncbi:2-hydroxyacid dehydrogenase [Phenylobacterium immobile]|uniref:2-hydroxyacid dehydrogenase n=1 Tax=Phenylobacterium immobile TaxID=21 RepID=UPI000AA228DE|nr:2-hydroxyacid dehydrogenase [Phenylobacterium immobile]